MRKNIKILMLGLIIVLCVILIFKLNQVKFEREKNLQQKLNNAYEYIEKKYGENLHLEILNYSEKDTFIANFSAKNNSDIRFCVKYWKNKEEFSDDYLQQLLSTELKSIISDQLFDMGILSADIQISSMYGAPFDLSERLYEYYQKLNRYPEIKDIKKNESFSSVTIRIHSTLKYEEIEKIENYLLGLDLPIEEIKFVTQRD